MEYSCTDSWIFRTWLIATFILVVLIGVETYQYLTALLVLYLGYKFLKRTLSNKVDVNGRGIFITGCDTGIGHEMAIRLAERGYTLFAGCLRADGDGAKILEQKTGSGLKMHVIPLDVTNDKSVDTALAKITEKLPNSGLWAVINNAGIGRYGHVELSSMKMMKLVAEVNFFGTVRVTKAFLPLIRKTKGRIINITSVNGRVAFPTNAAYVCSKFAAEAFSDVLRRELYRFGVKVVIIEPGNFAAATNILKGDNFKLLEAELDEAWEEASEDVKQAYGRASIDRLFKSISNVGDTSGDKGLESILRAVDDAVENVTPKYRYLVHGKWPLDSLCILAQLHGLLPECVMDQLCMPH